MKKLFVLALMVFTCLDQVNAQVDPLYAQYLNNPLLINPAYAGFTKNLNASLTYRKQWAGFDGSPSTVNASAHSSFLDNKMGLGLSIIQDKFGINNTTEIQASYAYKIDLNEKYISFGLQGGMINYKNDYSELNPYDPSAPEFSTNQVYTKPSFGAGIILNSDKYFIGLSVPRMLKNTVDFGAGETQLYQQHYYLTAGYVLFLNERIRMKPSVLLKAVSGAPVSVDYNFSFNIDEKYTAGVYTRNLKAYGLLAQMKLSDKYRFGYAFEVPTNQSVGARYTSHEFMIGVNLSVFDFHENAVLSF